MTQTTVDLTDAALQRVLEDLYVATDTAAVDPADLGNLLADLTLETERTDPMRHIGLLYAVLQAMADGGMDVRKHAPCALGELE